MAIESLSAHYQGELDKFNDFTPQKLIRKDIGQMGFPLLEKKLKVMSQMLLELLAIVESIENLPNEYIDALFAYINQYNDAGTELINYNPENADSFQRKQNFINAVERLYKIMITGVDPNGQYSTVIMPFLYLYTILKQRQIDNLSSALDDAENNKKIFIKLKENADTLLSSLQDKAKEVSLYDYSNVFSKQSKSHSNWDWREMGAGQYWLILTLMLTICFGIFVSNINSIYPIETNVNVTIITIEYLTRVLIVSFSIFLISFCAKQFNIQQHLSVVNKHRENTLNSYKLFIDSLGDNDTEIKPALMMEVAKAIYESGQTGYLGSNDKSDGSLSMVEMTKYVGGSK